MIPNQRIMWEYNYLPIGEALPADTVRTLHRQCPRLLDSVRNLKALLSAKLVATNLLCIVYKLFVIQPNNKKQVITLIAPPTLSFYVQYLTI